MSIVDGDKKKKKKKNKASKPQFNKEYNKKKSSNTESYRIYFIFQMMCICDEMNRKNYIHFFT